MKLYSLPGACSTSCHIALEEAGLSYTPLLVDFEKPDANVADLERLNPLGAAPVLVNDQGKTLTQNIAILEYVADQKPGSHLLAEKGSWERAETMSWLSFVASDLHKAFGGIFRAAHMSKSQDAQAEIKAFAKKNIAELLTHVDKNLVGKDYITGKHFTIADAYLFVVVNWCNDVAIPITEYKNLSTYMSRVYQRPAVQKVMKAEGLLD
jgi:glutathione S-transferase